MGSKIILASKSPRRQELLAHIGLPYIIEESQTEEVTAKTLPWEVVAELAALKAGDVADRHRAEDVVIIGADTIVAYEKRILGKPHSEKEAEDMLFMLSGAVHQVYTGVSIVCPSRNYRKTFVEKTDVEFYTMTEEEVRDYVKTGDCMDKAGSYGIQTAFSVYVKRISGDYNNVVGLPVARLYHELKSDLPELFV